MHEILCNVACWLFVGFQENQVFDLYFTWITVEGRFCNELILETLK